MKTIIKSTKDVENFFSHLLEKESLNFHPDEDFKHYFHVETKVPSYSTEESEIRNKLMKDCFEVCEKEGVDIYSIGATKLFLKLKA